MNSYETIMLLSSKVDDDARKEVYENIKNYLNENGTIIKTEELGKRKMAYEVRGESEAYYYVIEFDSNSECVYELERQYRITDEVIKFMTIKKDD